MLQFLPKRTALITSIVFFFGASIPLLLDKLFLSLVDSPIAYALLTGFASVGIYKILSNTFSSVTMNIKNTHLEILRIHFDPSSPPLVDQAGINDLNDSGLIFSTIKLCPCKDNDKKLCPCEENFNIYDPIGDNHQLTFFNGYTGANIQITPSTVGALHKYEIDESLFQTQSGDTHIRILKNNQELHIKQL